MWHGNRGRRQDVHSKCQPPSTTTLAARLWVINQHFPNISVGLKKTVKGKQNARTLPRGGLTHLPSELEHTSHLHY